MSETMDNSVEVVVVGGGAAGLSAALTLARARRRVVLVDAGRQRNLPAAGVHGFLTRDGLEPAALVAQGRAEVTRYGGTVRTGEVVSIIRDGDRFAITLDDGAVLRALRVVAATGVVDELPDVPGLPARWGRDVVHCPYCHGYEIRDQAVGVLASGPMSTHQALLFRQWSDDVTLFTAGRDLEPDDVERLTARGVHIVPGAVRELVVTDDRLRGVRLADGTVVARQVLAVASRPVARAGVFAGLGLTPVPHPMGVEVGELLPTIDPTGRTAVPGLWVAGNVTEPMAQVVGAAAQGTLAGAAVNADLVEAETVAAVALSRASRPVHAPR